MKYDAIALCEDLEANVERRPVYSHLLYLPDQSQKLLRLGESIKYPKDYILLEAEEESKYCYVVKCGRVLSYETYVNGEERIYHFYEEGAIFLEENILFGQTSSFAFRTACETELIRIDKNQIYTAILQDSQLALDIIEAASSKFQSAMELVRHEKNYTIIWKICDLFISFAEHKGKRYGNKILIYEKISQQAISDLLGVNRITTVRAIKELKDLGLIETVKGMYCIPHKEKLLDYMRKQDKRNKIIV